MLHSDYVELLAFYQLKQEDNKQQVELTPQQKLDAYLADTGGRVM